MTISESHRHSRRDTEILQRCSRLRLNFLTFYISNRFYDEINVVKCRCQLLWGPSYIQLDFWVESSLSRLSIQNIFDLCIATIYVHGCYHETVPEKNKWKNCFYIDYYISFSLGWQLSQRSQWGKTCILHIWRWSGFMFQGLGTKRWVQLIFWWYQWWLIPVTCFDVWEFET